MSEVREDGHPSSSTESKFALPLPFGSIQASDRLAAARLRW